MELLIYSFKFDEKVEQYDEHIALYVNNTFVRTRFRYPHYMYEENWLIMRTLSDDELQEAVLKYVIQMIIIINIGNLMEFIDSNF